MKHRPGIDVDEFAAHRLDDVFLLVDHVRPLVRISPLGVDRGAKAPDSFHPGPRMDDVRLVHAAAFPDPLQALALIEYRTPRTLRDEGIGGEGDDEPIAHR